MSSSRRWRTPPELTEAKHHYRLIEFDENTRSRELGNAPESHQLSVSFRALLSESPLPLVRKLACICIQRALTRPLQDVVNELGRRFGFDVENGPYRGRWEGPGYDGLWSLPDGRLVIVEVLYEDAWVFNATAIARCRSLLFQSGRLEGKTFSFLLLPSEQGSFAKGSLGPEDASPVLAMGLTFLVKLAHLRETLEDPAAIRQIAEVFIPSEHIQADAIVARMSSSIELSTSAPMTPELGAGAESPWEPTESGDFREACISRLASREGVKFAAWSNSAFVSRDETVRAVVETSKEYGDADCAHFCFALHPSPHLFLNGAKRGFLVLVCGTPDKAVALPRAFLRTLRKDFPTGERRLASFYWHLHVVRFGGQIWIDPEDGGEPLEITNYAL